MSAVTLCTDSSAQLTPALVAALGVTVVPMQVTVDDATFAEGVDLDVDWFYARLAAGARVTTSQPSPGAFADAYARPGCERMLSLHLDASVSGTVGSASLAARAAPVPVHVVDTKTASFGVAICVLEVAEALTRGISETVALDLVETMARRIGNVFVAAGAPGGRVPATPGLPIFSFTAGRSEQIAAASTHEEAADAMATHILDPPTRVRAAVGHAASCTEPAADRLATRLEQATSVVEVLRYRVGPSVGAHTGDASFGAFWWPAR